MKTIQDIDQEITDLIKECKLAKNPERIKSKIAELRQYKRYLETEPREEFIREQIKTIEIRIENIDKNFSAWQVGRNITQYKDPLSAYHTQCGLPCLKASLKTLKYILNESN